MPRPLLKQLFWILLGLTIISGGALAQIDQGIRTPALPHGIVSYELCAYTGSCVDILRSWTVSEKQLAILSLGLDYLFMALYPATIACGLWLLAPLVPARLERFTEGSGWWAWVAGIADAVENYGLTQMVLTDETAGWDWLAAAAATLKFVVVAHTLGWLLVAFLIVAFRRRAQA